jgi:hypothetical protein
LTEENPALKGEDLVLKEREDLALIEQEDQAMTEQEDQALKGEGQAEREEAQALIEQEI